MLPFFLAIGSLLSSGRIPGLNTSKEVILYERADRLKDLEDFMTLFRRNLERMYSRLGRLGFYEEIFNGEKESSCNMYYRR